MIIKKGKLRTLLIVLLDCFIIIAAGGFAMLVRFEFSFSGIPTEYITYWQQMLPIQCLVTVAVFLLRRMYHYVWYSVNIHDVLDMIFSVLIAFLANELVRWIAAMQMPVSVTFFTLMCQLFGLVGMRCAYRFLDAIRKICSPMQGKARIMLVGAGSAGQILLREISTSGRIVGKVRCVIDDDPEKHGKYLDGVPIVGGREKIPAAAQHEKITQIIFAIPSARPEDRKAILDLCQGTGCRVRVLPGIYQLVNGEVNLSAVKDIQVEDLLGREPVKLNLQALNGFLGGKTVLITGGGGSIGSELCRQIVQYLPARLIILDIYENNAYDIQQELRLACPPDVEVRVEIASIRDQERVDSIFNTYRPQIVFHAAAHKHVPLMEDCPAEAVKNNIFGTYHVVLAAEKYGVEKFVMISTDKAVNPTNFMGATKRFCEMILQSCTGSATEFCAVRFGNVLGSNGSVVPLFRRQIEAGGPVTITDKRIIRYFMTIPEASQLVLEAGAMAGRGQIFVLDMGEPVKILTLAENLIRLSGLEPYRDIDIQEIGLRPGEKLYEELLTASADLSRTANESIFVEQQQTIPPEQIRDALQALRAAVAEDIPPAELIALMHRLVPTYKKPEEVNSFIPNGADVPPLEENPGRTRVACL